MDTPLALLYKALVTKSVRRIAWLASLATLYGAVHVLVCIGVVARAPAVGLAALADLTLSAAFVTWLIGARHGVVPRRAPIVVATLGLVIARLLLPAELRATVGVARLGLVMVEVGVAAALVLGARGKLGWIIGDVPTRLILGEWRMLGLALFGWRRSTPVEDERTFSMHRRSHLGVVVAVLLYLLAVESGCLHLLLARWSPTAAWIATASSVWLALWIIADAQATRLHPLKLEEHALELDVGLRVRARIPYHSIVEIGAARTKDAFEATLLGRTDVALRVSTPQSAHRLGRERRFEQIVFSVDRADELVTELRARIASSNQDLPGVLAANPSSR